MLPGRDRNNCLIVITQASGPSGAGAASRSVSDEKWHRARRLLHATHRA
jgi:hypothetical protein